MKPSNNLVECDICFKQIAPSSVFRHRRRHSRDESVVCQYCDKRYAHNDALMYHEVRVHKIDVERQHGRYKKKNTGKKPTEWVNCPVCQKVVSKVNLQQHGTIHSEDTPFRCEGCDKSFRLESLLKDHVNRVHDLNEERQCDICEQTFISKHNFYEHKKKEHTESKPYKCKECDKSFKSKYYLMQHFRMVHDETQDVQCQVCEKVFRGAVKLKSHIKGHNLGIQSCDQCEYKGKYLEKHQQVMHSNNNTPLLKCQFCPKSFKGRRLLRPHERSHTMVKVSCQVCPYEGIHIKDHMRKAHSERKKESTRIKCTLCQKMLIKSSIRNHYLIHSGAKPFECKICSYSFTSNSNLKAHISSIHEEKPDLPVLKCKYCERSVQGRKKLATHERIHTLETLLCNKCDYEGKYLQLHIKQYHDRVTAKKKKKYSAKKKECSICHKSVVSIRYHMEAHSPTGSYDCETCKKAFKQKILLKKHVKNVHGEKNIACSFCPLMFPDIQTKNHHEQIHTGKRKYKRFKCDSCEKDYNRKTALLFHQLKEHQITDIQLTVYECKICGKEFPEISFLEKHIRVHDTLREAKYKCEECGKNFYTEKNMINHKIIHTDLKPYSCKHCNKSFNNAGSRSHHQRKMHVAIPI